MAAKIVFHRALKLSMSHFCSDSTSKLILSFMSCWNICKYKASTSRLTSIKWDLNPPQTHSFEVLDIMARNLFERTFILRRPQTLSIGHFQVYLCIWNPYLLFSGTRCLYVGSAFWLSGLSFICFNVVERTLDKSFGRNPKVEALLRFILIPGKAGKWN